jgi:hypothetical protein
MKYFTFDCKSLIRDFEKNKRTLASVYEALRAAQGHLESPNDETSESELKLFIKRLEALRDEYEWYTDMVILGLNDLPEAERLILKWWLIDRRDDYEIAENAGVDDLDELTKIKRISLKKFHDLVLP